MPRVQIEDETAGAVNVYMIQDALILLTERYTRMEEFLGECYSGLRERYVEDGVDPPKSIGILPLLNYAPEESTIRADVLDAYRMAMHAMPKRKPSKPNKPRRRLL